MRIECGVVIDHQSLEGVGSQVSLFHFPQIKLYDLHCDDQTGLSAEIFAVDCSRLWEGYAREKVRKEDDYSLLFLVAV